MADNEIPKEPWPLAPQRESRPTRLAYPGDKTGRSVRSAQIRQNLSHRALQVIGTAYQEGRALSHNEATWVAEALLWINWNPGAVGPTNRYEGVALITRFREEDLK